MCCVIDRVRREPYDDKKKKRTQNFRNETLVNYFFDFVRSAVACVRITRSCLLSRRCRTRARERRRREKQTWRENHTPRPLRRVSTDRSREFPNVNERVRTCRVHRRWRVPKHATGTGLQRRPDGLIREKRDHACSPGIVCMCVCVDLWYSVKDTVQFITINVCELCKPLRFGENCRKK